MSGRQDDRGAKATRPDASGAKPAEQALSALLGGETATSRTFIAGLIAGALVGAAVAGGQLLRRRLGR